MTKNLDPTQQTLLELIAYLCDEVEIQERMADGQTFLVSGDGHFLGRITRPEDEDSILNRSGLFGSADSPNSIFSAEGPYGSFDGDLSLRSEHASNPPIFVLRGEVWGVVSDNSEIPERRVSSEKFFATLKRDWKSLLHDHLSDSGSMRQSAPTN